MTVQIFTCNPLAVTKKYWSPSTLQLLIHWCPFDLYVVLCDDIFSFWCPHVVELQAGQIQVYLFEGRQWRLQYQAIVYVLLKGAPVQVSCNTSEFSYVSKNFLPNFQLVNHVHNKILYGISICCHILPPFLIGWGLEKKKWVLCMWCVLFKQIRNVQRLVRGQVLQLLVFAVIFNGY